MAAEVLTSEVSPVGAVERPYPQGRILADTEVAVFARSHGLDADGLRLAGNGTNRLYRLNDQQGRSVWLKCGERRREVEGDLLAEGLFHLAVQVCRLEVPVARAVLHDRELDVLVTRHVDGEPARSLLDAPDASEAGHVAHELGRVLAHLHQEIDVEPVRRMLSRHVGSLLPSVAPLSSTEYADQSLGSLHLLRTVFADVEWRRALSLLHRVWRPVSPVHGDFRCDNLLRAETGFVVLDWEYARLGDPLYDVGMFFADRLEAGVAAVARATQRDTPEPRDYVWRALSAALVQIRPFWAGYRRVRDGIGPTAPVMVWAMAGAGLLHRLFGASMLRQTLHKQDFVMMSLARILMTNPQRFAAGLAA